MGFASGALAVWLTALASVWNWPVSIANAVFFGILFFEAKLFADMALQSVYIILSIVGWYWWLRGGEHNSALTISHTPRRDIIWLSVITVLCTYIMTLYLRNVSDSAPFWDALTTVLSLVATYLLTKKYIENWYVWIAADIVYIPLYFFKNLYLTGIVYILFMSMCFVGLKEWSRIKRSYNKLPNDL
jgi:nicotinamide mononucleotide transporter